VHQYRTDKLKQVELEQRVIKHMEVGGRGEGRANGGGEGILHRIYFQHCGQQVFQLSVIRSTGQRTEHRIQAHRMCPAVQPGRRELKLMHPCTINLTAANHTTRDVITSSYNI
jgi:hypothetical protein